MSIPYWCKDKPKPPINAKAETVDRLPTFREAYRERHASYAAKNPVLRVEKFPAREFAGSHAVPPIAVSDQPNAVSAAAGAALGRISYYTRAWRSQHRPASRACTVVSFLWIAAALGLSVTVNTG